MEVELEPRVKPLGFKIKAMSRESPVQKAAHVLDPDLRSHWSTGTNTKEWILLELDEPCLLSQIRIYNKSVLEWEITAGLRYKPESFIKVRPRCESPRREVMYLMNYTPCRYVRISCLRGNPIAIFFIQLIGVSVAGLEPEFQPVVNYLLPHIISHKHETHDMHLQLLQDLTNRLLVFLPQLETDLTNFTDTAESSIRYLAMLVGPFYPFLRIVNEREAAKALVNTSDSDTFRNNQTSTLMVSSNFEAQPRRSRSPSHFTQTASSSIAFRPDAVIMLLRKAYKDFHLGIVCRLASRALQKLVEPGTSLEEYPATDLATSGVSDELAKVDSLGHLPLTDYSSLFGEEFKILDDRCDTSYLNVLDIASVEEGVLHVLYACVSQPDLCCKLADTNSDLWSTLPLVQALLPALRPPISSPPDQVDDSLWQWKHPFVQQALTQIVAMASSSAYRPLLHACAGYLSSFMSSHAKTACVLIDLCCGPLSPWISTVTAKVDLAVELLEDLLGIIQGARQSTSRARAALKYTILALSGHMDDVLAKYKEFKHNLLFLLEMLEPFLDPATTAINNTIAFGDVSGIFLEKQERTCVIALNIIRTALLRPAVLPSLESEWRRGSVAPSILLSVLGPHMQLPPEIDLCKCSASKAVDQESSLLLANSSQHSYGDPSKSCSLDEFDRKNEVSEATSKIDVYEDANYLFAPREIKSMVLTSVGNYFIGNSPGKTSAELIHDTAGKVSGDQLQNALTLDNGFYVKYFNLQADYLQLVNYHDCEARASEYQHLAMDLSAQYDINPESHDAVVDALLLAAECYVNPFFMMSFRPASNSINQMKSIKYKVNQKDDVVELKKVFERYSNSLEQVAHLESNRDKTVLHILLQAARLDEEYERNRSKGELHAYDYKGNEQCIDISPLDIQSLDAVTLVRRNQFLLCQFVMKQLRRERCSPHEVLLQSLLFLLLSATDLSCPPEDVVDIILCSAENLNLLITSFYDQLKEGKTQFDAEKLRGAQRHWVLLQRLVTASSGSIEGTDFISHTRNGFQYRSLVPPSSWIQKISKFSDCPFALARFLGWMAVSRHAQQYLKDRLFFVSDLSQLSSLLSIFADDLALVGNVKDQKFESADQSNMKQYLQVGKELGRSNHSDSIDSFHILYPDLHKFFPNMKNQFHMFGESILGAVGVQLKCFPSNALPDVLCWFSDLCLSPYPELKKDSLSILNQADCLKGHVSTNVKAILLYILESIIGEHMEAMLPEMPRVAQILISICRSSYCDVPFLDSVLCLLRPLISYFLRKVTFDEKLLTDVVSGSDFDLENFKELFEFLRLKEENQDSLRGKEIQGSLMIFTLGSLFCDLSFRRKSEVLQSLLSWVDFSTSEPISSFYNYLHAFQKVMDSCSILLVQSIESFGISIPLENQLSSEDDTTLIVGSNSTSPSGFQTSAGQSSLSKSDRKGSNGAMTGFFDQGVHRLSSDELCELSGHLELLISKLIPSVEICWNLHGKLAMKLTFALAKCFMYLTCLASIIQATNKDSDGDGGEICLSESRNLLSRHWVVALEGFSKFIVAIQQNQNWQVASAMTEYLLRLPQDFSLNCVIGNVCSTIKSFCCHAPRFSWRLQSDKWLLSLFTRGIGNIDGNEGSVVDLFHAMLGHSEPEQRAVALQHLGRIIGLGTNDEVAGVFYTLRQSLVGSDSDISIPESFLSILVSTTWNMVATLALTDSSLLLRRHAMALLSGYIPFATRGQLQSFLIASNTIIRGIGRLSHSMEEVHLTRLSLCLLASVCLYSPAEDIALVPESVWENLESMRTSRSGELDLMEKNLCSALCKIRNEAVDAKEVLKGVLSSSSAAKQIDPNFEGTRQTILQVLSSLTSVQSYFDFFSKNIEQDLQELEEAEIEMELLQEEKATEVSASSKLESAESHEITYDLEDNNRLQKIKDEIRSLEKAKIREEIVGRRQKKLLMRRARQKFLEEAALKEMNLLQDLDRERASELEREIEREQSLELERAKTRELQYNLDMERERQTQRELQREMEQVESGIRPSRRDFSSNTTRPRERYRESGRSGQEGSLRASSRGHEGGSNAQAATSGPNMSSQAPTVVLTGARSFSGQLPTILQPRDRAEERSGGYDDNLEGNRDSGDTGSVGDPELSSAFDSFGSASRHGSRGSKSRQVTDRRDRDGRGKWERKHN
ncbi:putative Galactose-binding-like domain superfamily [Dioscorea sansibarensis]